jgi:hypothetical protein
MKPTLKFAAPLLVLFSLQGCEDMDDTAPINLEVQDYMERNQYYLWQPDVPNLSDDRFASQNKLNTLQTYPVLRNYLMR